MITRRINAYLKGSRLWDSATPSCRNAFTRAMRGCQYGREPLHTAMIWFVEGWKAADIARLIDNVGQINTDHPPQNISQPF